MSDCTQHHCWHPFGATFPMFGGASLSFCCRPGCKHIHLGLAGEEKTHGLPYVPKIVVDEHTAKNFVEVLE